MNRREKFFSIIILMAVLFLLAFFDIPDFVVSTVGPENTYIAIFLVAAFGGVSSFTALSYFSTIVAFAADPNLSPWLLALAGGIGITIGDSLFFFFGKHGRVVVTMRVEKFMNGLKKRLERFNEWAIPIFVYLYAGFTPFPNEFMTISVGLTGARYKKIVVPLLLGNITVTLFTILSVKYVIGL